MKHWFLLGFLLLIPISSSGADLRKITPLRTCLSNIPLNAGAADRTFQWPCVTRGKPRDASGYDAAVITVHFTHANDGVITFTCTNTDDNGVTQNTPQLCPAGTCGDSGVFATSAALTASKDYTIKLSIAGLTEGQCVVSHGGTPNASDRIKVSWRMYVGGKS